MRLTVRQTGRVRVTCHLRCAKRDILAFVKQSQAFIEKAFRELTEHEKMHPSRQYLSGETLLFRGETLRLELVWSWDRSATVNAAEGVLELKAPLKSEVVHRARAIEEFYRQHAREQLTHRLRYWIQKTGLEPKSVSIRGQKTRWGSCSARGEISLNWKLMAVPPSVMDYVIVHELCHLEHMNHSPAFWNTVGRWIPDYKSLRLSLKRLEPQITAQFRLRSK